MFASVKCFLRLSFSLMLLILYKVAQQNKCQYIQNQRPTALPIGIDMTVCALDWRTAVLGSILASAALRHVERRNDIINSCLHIAC